jgi:hypothetical protein
LREAAEVAASEIGPFTVKVSGVALLGDDQASVLLLESKELVELYRWLMAHPAVETALKAGEQFPWWVPHLTIRYEGGLLEDPPETISFDRLGLWMGEVKETYDLQGTGFEPVMASALSIPLIQSKADLSLGIRYGNEVPDSRWYVIKRAEALGASASLPASWSTP